MNIAYNMDCMEAMRDMPDKCFDLAEVDPPYYENARSIRRLDMTIEEAIKVINPDEHDPEAAKILNRYDDLQEGVREAHRVVIAALRTHEAPPPNDPLTLEQLREMAGEPVWVSTGRLSEWCIVHSCHSDDVIGGGVIMTRRTAEKRTYPYADCGKTWLAYRRKPEEIPYERLD